MSSYYESQEEGKYGKRRAATPVDFQAVGLSDPGCEREANEDRFLLVNRGDMAACFVFDGMGGQPGGEAAAHISSAAINDAILSFEGSDLMLCMYRAVEMAQAELLVRSQRPESLGMGTTVVGVLTSGSKLVVGAVGDSRAYHIKKGSITQLTCDHTLVQQLVDAGKISAQDALVHPQSHILTRCIGSTLDFSVDARAYDLNLFTDSSASPSEWLLLCSDGLYSLVSDEEMASIVFNFSSKEATAKLIGLARQRGGFDNITAVVLPLPGQMVYSLPKAAQESHPSGMPALPEESRVSSAFKLAPADLFESLEQRSANQLTLYKISLAVILVLLAISLVSLVFFTVMRG